jgi:hypothetical protein
VRPHRARSGLLAAIIFMARPPCATTARLP